MDHGELSVHGQLYLGTGVRDVTTASSCVSWEEVLQYDQSIDTAIQPRHVWAGDRASRRWIGD